MRQCCGSIFGKIIYRYIILGCAAIVKIEAKSAVIFSVLKYCIYPKNNEVRIVRVPLVAFQLMQMWEIRREMTIYSDATI